MHILESIKNPKKIAVVGIIYSVVKLKTFHSIFRSFTKLLLFCKASEYRMKGLKLNYWVLCFLLKFYILESIYIRGSYFKCFGAKACRRYFETFFWKMNRYIKDTFSMLFFPCSTTFISDRIPNLSGSTEDHSTEWNYLTSGLRFLPDLYSSLKF